MITYHPLSSPAPWSDADHADLVSFDWEKGVASFGTTEDDRILEVRFSASELTVRILKDFAFSTENVAIAKSGFILHHFAYLVEGDPFFDTQSEAWRGIVEPKHFRFLTGWTCLDVLSPKEPTFALVTA